MAQITSGSIERTITDSEDKEPLIGAVISATHTPTGTVYYQTVQLDGSYVLTNLRTGGPYTLEVSYVSFAPFVQKDIYVQLGQSTYLNLELKAKSVLDIPIVVTVDKDDSFSGSKDGVPTNLDAKKLEKTPSLNRSLQDVTRLIPNGFQSSFGGNNYRFNNLNIDGVSNNNVIGFQEPTSGAEGSVASGTPGALTGIQPISLDAIEESILDIVRYMKNYENDLTRKGKTIPSYRFFDEHEWRYVPSLHELDGAPTILHIDNYENNLFSGLFIFNEL